MIPPDLSAVAGCRLVPLRPGHTPGGRAGWVCRCEPELGGCGKETAVIPTGKLTSGRTRSCGCLYADTRPSDTGHMAPAADERRTCPRCAREFVPRAAKQTYCGRRCAAATHAQQRRDRGTAYQRPKSDGPRTCPVCGVVFAEAHGLKRFCSPACYTVHRSRAKLTGRAGTPDQQAVRIQTELEKRSDATNKN